MTLHEIDETLQTLRGRHSGLDEAMLVTLLRAGGWEEKQIEEAKIVFRGGASSEQNAPQIGNEKESVSFPTVQEESVLPPPVDEGHLLAAHNDLPKVEASEKIITEPQSLVVEKAETRMDKRETLPHNLPLRPFETSEHIWPFSRYRDVFYGDTLEESREETNSPTPPADAVRDIYTHPVATAAEVKPEEPTAKEMVSEKSIESIPKKEAVEPEPHREPVKFSSGDEKLVVTASVMLLIVLLLLGYMYSNGRL